MWLWSGFHVHYRSTRRDILCSKVAFNHWMPFRSDLELSYRFQMVPITKIWHFAAQMMIILNLKDSDRSLRIKLQVLSMKRVTCVCSEFPPHSNSNSESTPVLRGVSCLEGVEQPRMVESVNGHAVKNHESVGGHADRQTTACQDHSISLGNLDFTFRLC